MRFSVCKTPHPNRSPALAFWFLQLCALCLSGCSPFYVLRAGYEEAKILWHRRPIREILARPDLDAEARQKLELVLAARRFAREKLGFQVGGSYSTLAELERSPTVHIVSAAYRDRLEPYTWWFPIVGRIAYKGFFDEAAAQKEASRLEAQGYDTHVRTAAAFSTLGWFDDPLLPHLLHYDAVALANVVFHELFHNTFYLSNQSAFNESLANFAGSRAAIDFFAFREGEGSENYRLALAAWKDELRFSSFLGQAVRRLGTFYRTTSSREEVLEKRKEIFRQIQEDFRRLPLHTHRNSGFAQEKLNNAVLLHYFLYEQELGLFEEAYQQMGKNLRRALEHITLWAQNGKDPFAAVRLALSSKPPLPRPATLLSHP